MSAQPRGHAAALLLFFLLGGVALADDKIGSFTYVEGSVAVIRDGAEVDGVAIGQDVQNFDVVKTGSDGMAELEISAPQAPRMTVKVSPDTQFSLEISALEGGKQQSTIGFLGGSLSFKVAKLLGTQGMSVMTDSAVMGVRGTQFTATSPPSGDVLVTCDEGEVATTDDQGKELRAVPGTVVEKRPGELFRATPVAVTSLESYRTQWAAERAQAVENNALKLIQANAKLYDRLVGELNATHAELMKSRAILTKWTDEDKKGRIGLRADVARERLAIGALLARLRRTQFQLERVSFRLERLFLYHEKGFGRGTLEGGVTTTQFFQRVAKERADVEQKLALTRYVAKMFAKRNEGRMP